MQANSAKVAVLKNVVRSRAIISSTRCDLVETAIGAGSWERVCPLMFCHVCGDTVKRSGAVKKIVLLSVRVLQHNDYPAQSVLGNI